MTIIDKKCLEKLVRGIPKDNMSKDALIRLRRLLYTLRDAYNIKGFECLVEEGLMVSHKIEHLKGAAREVSSEYLLQVPATLKNLASEWCALDSQTHVHKPKTTCHTHTRRRLPSRLMLQPRGQPGHAAPRGQRRRRRGHHGV